MALLSHISRHWQQASVPPPAPARCACIGGHGTEPYEQKTQQSPGFGRNLSPQPVHS
jgi:hypothetical protein